MKTIFIGGSRSIAKLNRGFVELLDLVISKRDSIIIGDAAGADKLIQMHLETRGYREVTVFHSGKIGRFNIGVWATISVNSNLSKGSFGYYSEKDRLMAAEADAGLMIWDKTSRGTILNVVRMIELGKPVVVFYSDGDRYNQVRTKIEMSKMIDKLDLNIKEKVMASITKEFPNYTLNQISII